MSDSDSSEDEVRVARSAKDRTLVAMADKIKSLRNAMKIHDWVKIQNDWDVMTKQLEKNLKSIGHAYPKDYIQMLVQLSDFVKMSLADKPKFKKLSPSNGRALNRMKQVCRRAIESHSDDVAHYRANPEAYVEDVEESSDNDSESDSDSSSSSSSSSGSSSSSSSSSSSGSESSSNGSGSSSEEGEESDSEAEWDNDSSSSSSSSEESDQGELKGRARWLKKVVVTKEKVKKDKTGRAAAREAAKAEKEAAAAAESEAAQKVEAYTPETLFAKLQTLIVQRGRRGISRHQYMTQFGELAFYAREMPMNLQIRVWFQYIQAMIDTSVKVDECMGDDVWRRCAGAILSVIDTLSDGSEFKLVPRKDNITVATDAEEKFDENEKTIPLNSILIQSFCSTLNNEFNKSLLALNGNVAYSKRLCDLSTLLAVLEKGRKYFYAIKKFSEAAQLATLHMEQISAVDSQTWKCFVSDANELNVSDEMFLLHPASPVEGMDITLITPKKENEEGENKEEEDKDIELKPIKMPIPSIDEALVSCVSDLAKLVYKYAANEQNKTHALLCHTINMSIQGDYHAAKDLLLLSHLQENINNAHIR